MNAGYDIAINLISAALGAAIGVFWTFGKSKFKYRRQRAFWRFLEQPTVLVIGDLVPEILLDTLADTLQDIAETQQRRQMIIDRVMTHLYSQEISGLILKATMSSEIRNLA